MILFRILFAFDLLFVLVLGYFYVDGLKYAGSGGGSAIWLPVLSIPIAALVGAWALRSGGRIWIANILLGMLAVPPLLYALFVGAIIIVDPNWQ